MTVELVDVRRDAYADSVQLMTATRSMLEQEGVEWAAALMGTSANLEVLAAEGFADAGPGEVTVSDVVIAVRAQSDGQARQALEAAGTALAGTALAGPASADARQKAEPRSLEEAVRLLPDANTALISVAGPYAAIEAHKALSHGLHTLLFSDNVSVADEIGLKRRARDLGLLLMGPGAGTSFLGGTGLGFSNAVRSGPVGVVAGAGTGAQEIMTLVHRWGSGISSLIGIGGRDLHDEVGGLMGDLALSALLDDEETKVIVLVAKPPSPRVAGSLLTRLGAEAGRGLLRRPAGELSGPGRSPAGREHGGSGRRSGHTGRPRPSCRGTRPGGSGSGGSGEAEPPADCGPGTVFRRDALF